MLVVRACSISLLPSYLLRNTVNSRLTNTRLLRMLTITGKIQIPGESYWGLTGNDSHLYRLDNFIILILDKVDTTYFWYNLIILKLQSAVHHLLKNTSKYFCFPQLLFFCLYNFLSIQLSLLHGHCLFYLLHVEGTCYFTLSCYGLLLLQTLNNTCPWICLPNKSWL